MDGERKVNGPVAALRHPNSLAHGTLSTRLSKTGSLLRETHAVLEAWDLEKDQKWNLRNLVGQDLLGRGTRARTEYLIQEILRRYGQDRDLWAALVTLAPRDRSRTTLQTVLFATWVGRDPVLLRIMQHVVFPRYRSGYREIAVDDLLPFISKLINEPQTRTQWSLATQRRFATGVLAVLRDFRILRGARKKRLDPPYVEPGAVCFVSMHLWLKDVPAAKITSHPLWASLLLSPQDVEQRLLEAHQEKLVQYASAGSVVRLEFPARNLEEYARVVSE